MNHPHASTERLGLWLAVLLLVAGALWAWSTVSMAALHVPTCPTFSLDAPLPACRRPLLNLWAAGVTALVGLLGCLWSGYQRWRRAR